MTSREESARLRNRLMRKLQRANKRFGLIEPDDRVMVAISGGKDSWALLDLLREYRRKLPFEFSIVAVNLDQGHPGFPVHVLRDYLEAEDYEYRLIAEDTYSVVKANVPAGRAYCSLCSRLRRGVLYDVAERLGATKIALGHHRDDVIETALLNMLYSGQLKAMPARLQSDDGRNVVIRPLVLCAESDIAAYAEQRGFPIVPCDLCGSQEGLKRQEVKQLIATLEATNPLVRRSIMAALGNVKPTHLYDPDLRGPSRNAERPDREARHDANPVVDDSGRLTVLD